MRGVQVGVPGGVPGGVQVVVMGVSGVGKTTVAQGIASALGWEFTEGDDLHPHANLAKLAAGQPLTDDDRWPWLRSIADHLAAQAAAGSPGVVTCSALRRAYRDLLREGCPEVVFCHLDADEELVAERMRRRTGHFMPPSQLPDQLATLEPLEPDEPGVTVAADVDPAATVTRALAALGLPGGPGLPGRE